jgi:hypothetical protein
MVAFFQPLLRGRSPCMVFFLKKLRIGRNTTENAQVCSCCTLYSPGRANRLLPGQQSLAWPLYMSICRSQASYIMSCQISLIPGHWTGLFNLAEFNFDIRVRLTVSLVASMLLFSSCLIPALRCIAVMQVGRQAQSSSPYCHLVRNSPLAPELYKAMTSPLWVNHGPNIYKDTKS